MKNITKKIYLTLFILFSITLHYRRLRLRILILSLLMVTSNIYSAFSQAGTLDPTFDGDGIVMTPIGIVWEAASAVLVQPDGKIIAAGYSNSGSSTVLNVDFAVVRYNTDGSLDTSFSGDGKVVTDFGSISDYGFGALLQQDGKIVVSGKTFINGNSNYGCALARYNTDGSLDSSFDSDGRVTYDVSIYDDNMYKCAIQPDGKILLSGYGFGGSDDVTIIVRFDTTGNLDNTFGSGGVATIAVGGDLRCHDIAFLPSGKILAAGRYFNNTPTSEFALVRLHSDGTLDTSFGSSGLAITDIAGADDYGECLAVQPDGKIILAGHSGNLSSFTQLSMVRYHPSGEVDSTFGVNGRVTTAILNRDRCHAIVLQPDLKILLAGRVFDAIGIDNDFVVVRYTNSGALDLTFNNNGSAIVPIVTGHDVAFAIALQQDGKIVVGGRSEIVDDDDFALIRLHAHSDIPTATNEITGLADSGNITVFPNPANNALTIDNISGSSLEIKINIYDLSGRMIFSSLINQKKYQLNIEFLKAGTFICEVDNGIQRKRVLFNKVK